jgi:hypothetical protein
MHPFEGLCKNPQIPEETMEKVEAAKDVQEVDDTNASDGDEDTEKPATEGE